MVGRYPRGELQNSATGAGNLLGSRLRGGIGAGGHPFKCSEVTHMAALVGASGRSQPFFSA